ncbi:hypothetical protein IWQ47_005285 [Aquimarina sp. EL_43]|uniref:hypothetical protein n=1 Tax=unclassified Aquimarina TaxID=2627091 RepID=UPI0018CAF6F0|nr:MULTISPECIES: hypothetical protein [unclassified Aquimarina]MBG6133792.1 hypothetical protein [Aquimarina sp. EL_35]MBG6153948.1 hypothetical protein [Aquimarina sp. EL_32]MBG6172181.1 hypothetical protein [Aquimarina sp. EL_43]
MNRILVVIVFLISLFSCSSQKLDCTEIKEGNFVVSKDTAGNSPYKVIRNGRFQKEIVEGRIIYSNIEWLNDCNYILLLDENKMVLTDFQKQINKGGGIVVEIIKVDKTCFYYTSYIKIDPSERIDGMMCKE